MIKKEKYRYHDRDPDYYGIRDIEILLSEADEKDYYKPILVKSAFKDSYKKYESREGKDKKLSEKQYLSKIRPYLIDMINDHNDTAKINKSKEWKIQLCMHVNFISSKDTGETRTIYVWSENAKIMVGNETDDVIKELLESF